MLHSVYDQPDAAAVHAQLDRLLDYVGVKLPEPHQSLRTRRCGSESPDTPVRFRQCLSVAK